MKKLSLALFALLFAFGLSAQQLDQNAIGEIRNSLKMDAYTKGMQNALSNNDINNLAKNLENINEDDHNFTYRVDVKGITNQQKSGRCWLFTSLNLFRPKAMEVFNLNSFEFSQNYLYFWDLFEKANLYLNNMIETADKPIDDRYVQWYLRSPIDDGGMWSSFANLVDKYGMIPKEAMTETHSSDNTRDMVKFINLKLKEDGIRLREAAANGAKPKELQAKRTEMMKEVYRMLVLNLGVPPTEFTWRYEDKNKTVSDYQTYTPMQFKEQVLGDVQVKDYVMLMNDPTRPFNVHYEIDNYRNVEEGVNWHYVNLANRAIKAMAVESIKNNEAIYASCDVGQQLDRKYGILDVDNFDYESVYGVTFGMNKAERIQTGASGSSHGMALIAVDLDKNGNTTKWQFENSWGTEAGHKGYLTFTDEWFDEFMFRIVIHKKFVTPEVLKIYETEATLLPPWDWMF
ncbi:C1 family peptidase [uncultured Draconibacterium sp.]|uniref:aminopeptidase C n=1 Tax=uncultured Draconibacterium sp. TaxID=1573823 RepID=UPI00321645FB